MTIIIISKMRTFLYIQTMKIQEYNTIRYNTQYNIIQTKTKNNKDDMKNYMMIPQGATPANCGMSVRSLDRHRAVKNLV